jgi:hypothetical protein
MLSGTGRGTRTLTGLHPADFKSAASAVPPSRLRSILRPTKHRARILVLEDPGACDAECEASVPVAPGAL